LLEKYFLALSSFITSIYFFFFSMLVFGITSYFFIATIMGIFGSLNGSFRQNQILFLTFFIAFLSGYKSIIFIIKWKRREKELDKRK